MKSGESSREGRGEGVAYVVFGKTGDQNVELAKFDDETQGGQGFRIDGGFLLGRYIDGAGDVNRDGLDDVIVASPGTGYVVFGKPDSETVDLSSFDEGTQGLQGFRIATPVPESSLLYSVAGGGDVNGDGFFDVLIGVVPGSNAPGSAYVVFGKPDPGPVDVRSLGPWGFRIQGARRGSETGETVAGIGDFNGDQLDDVAIGAPARLQGIRQSFVYVVFGKRDAATIRLRDHDGSLRISSNLRYQEVGKMVSDAGDVNQDGLVDLQFLANVRPIENSPAIFIVLGGTESGALRIGNLGQRAYRITAGKENGFHALSRAGDINGDQCHDIVGTSSAPAIAYVVSSCGFVKPYP